MITFEDFLVDKHAEQYQGLDDEMPDDCDDWICDLSVDDLIEYGEKYGKEIRKEQIEKDARIVISATEIPKGARNPTRDAVVLLGENIEQLIHNQKP